MSYKNIAYYIARVAEENEAAKRSSRVEAAQVHLALATEYQKLAQGEGLPAIWRDYRLSDSEV